ncbi:MAG: glycosyltransferase N-terminal domain-containing protein [Vicingaceae bacterium]
MMRVIYNFSIYLLGFGIALSSLFNTKSKQWIKGRRSWRKNLKTSLSTIENPIWIHCSSLGEFEQGRPVIEALKERGEKILLTFFSPSGYLNLKDYRFADHVSYIPLDSTKNAKDFVKIVKPKAAIFIKYEFWFNHICACKKQSVPIFLLSGIFRSEQHFFKIYGHWFRKHLEWYSHIFVQNRESMSLLESIGMTNASISGDTRYDRVIKVATSPLPLSELDSWAKGKQVLVAGSTWVEDEKIIAQLASGEPSVAVIIAPHLVDKAHLDEIILLMGPAAMLYSQFLADPNSNPHVIVIDTIGLLSSIYRMADLVYIGGGFGKGVHNCLEAAVYGKVLFFGPRYQKFDEAKKMVAMGSAFPVTNAKEFLAKGRQYLTDDVAREALARKNGLFVKEHSGATAKVIDTLSGIIDV